jgi:hypothetical protein
VDPSGTFVPEARFGCRQLSWQLHIKIVAYRRNYLGGSVMIEAILLIVGTYIIVAEVVRRWREAAERAKSRNNRA